MNNVPITSAALDRAFIAALLLTGSRKEAETAVLEGIGVMDASEASEEALLLGTAEASLAVISSGQLVQGHVRSLLPPELRRVLRLSPDLRRCFVLRLLLRLPREVCARLLKIGIHRVDELVSLSAQELARLAQEETSRNRVSHCEPAGVSARVYDLVM